MLAAGASSRMDEIKHEYIHRLNAPFQPVVFSCKFQHAPVQFEYTVYVHTTDIFPLLLLFVNQDITLDSGSLPVLPTFHGCHFCLVVSFSICQCNWSIHFLSVLHILSVALVFCEFWHHH